MTKKRIAELPTIARISTGEQFVILLHLARAKMKIIGCACGTRSRSGKICKSCRSGCSSRCAREFSGRSRRHPAKICGGARTESRSGRMLLHDPSYRTRNGRTRSRHPTEAKATCWAGVHHRSRKWAAERNSCRRSCRCSCSHSQHTTWRLFSYSFHLQLDPRCGSSGSCIFSLFLQHVPQLLRVTFAGQRRIFTDRLTRGPSKLPQKRASCVVIVFHSVVVLHRVIDPLEEVAATLRAGPFVRAGPVQAAVFRLPPHRRFVCAAARRSIRTFAFGHGPPGGQPVPIRPQQFRNPLPLGGEVEVVALLAVDEAGILEDSLLLTSTR
mmetsp:Transcript_25631/g.64569  ORF Transcript_25631/g.64569 Transcript_25631/m.64569 type:complete len:326 (+) Transcript_25631:5769-6746(+)